MVGVEAWSNKRRSVKQHMMMGTMGEMVRKAPREVKSKKKQGRYHSIGYFEAPVSTFCSAPAAASGKSIRSTAHETSLYFLKLQVLFLSPDNPLIIISVIPMMIFMIVINMI